MELEHNFNVQRAPCDEKNTLRWYLNVHGWFLGVRNSKNHFRVIWRHWPLMARWFHDLISSLLSAKWMSESKSAPQITLEGSRTRKNQKKLIDLIWPQLTSFDLRRTGWPVECMSSTWYYMSTLISLAKTAMLLCATERIFRLTWPQLWRHRSNVRAVRVLKFSGWRKKKWSEAIEEIMKFDRQTRNIFQKKQQGVHQPSCAGQG